MPESLCTSLVAQVKPGETLPVLGAAGGVGLTSVEPGNLAGARVIAAASSADKPELARQYGASEGIDYRDEPLAERVKALTAGNGADVIGQGYYQNVIFIQRLVTDFFEKRSTAARGVPGVPPWLAANRLLDNTSN